MDMLPLLLLSGLAFADDPVVSASAAPAPADAPVGPRLPVPLRIAPATWPADALAAGHEATVILEVDVSATGAVLDVQVVTPAGEGFDEAAVQALLASRFEPAIDANGVPAEARIQYAFRFTLDAVASKSIEGTVVGPDGAAVAGAAIEALGPDGALGRARTDDQGRFALSGLSPGAWHVDVAAKDLVPTDTNVTVAAGEVATAAFQLAAPARAVNSEGTEVITVTGERQTVEVGSRALTKDEIRVLPGTNGDVVRAVQNLPGIARPPLNIGQLIIRGTPPEDSSAFLDGQRVPNVFHFSGLSTIVNGELIDSVAYVPGNAPVRYGRILGGFVDLRTSAKLPEEALHTAAVDIFQTTVLTRDRIGDHSAVTLSARRSYIDAVLTPILSSGTTTVRAPRYYDGQARYQHEDALGGVWDGWLLASKDAFRVLGEEDADGKASTQIGLQTTFWRARLGRRGPIGGGWSNESTASFGPDIQKFQFQIDGQALEKTLGLQLREEFSREARGLVPGVRFGLDAEAGKDTYLYDVPAFGPKESGEGWRIAPALYAEGTWDLGGLELIGGVRGDAIAWKGVYASSSADPRLSAKLALSKKVDLIGGVGQYSKFPTLRQVEPGADGNPDLTPSRAIQSSLGVEVKPWEGVEATATGFYNTLGKLVVGREDRLRFFTGPPSVGPFDTGAYANDGTGFVCGAEGLVKFTHGETLGLVALTLSHSERTKRPGQASALFEYDQPIVVNAVLSQGLPKGWRLGARARYGSGNPYTPVVNRLYDLSSRDFVPIYGARDSDRLPPFFSLDVRIDKKWTFDHWSLTGYLDVANATYRKNVEVMDWTYDYGAENPVAGLPPTPTFGVEARF